jgi:hypothetical protein
MAALMICGYVSNARGDVVIGIFRLLRCPRSERGGEAGHGGRPAGNAQHTVLGDWDLSARTEANCLLYQDQDRDEGDGGVAWRLSR